MDRTKLKRQIKKFEEYLVVERGLSQNTSRGYCRSVSIALRRMRKMNPKYVDIKKLVKYCLTSYDLGQRPLKISLLFLEV